MRLRKYCKIRETDENEAIKTRKRIFSVSLGNLGQFYTIFVIRFFPYFTKDYGFFSI